VRTAGIGDVVSVVGRTLRRATVITTESSEDSRSLGADVGAMQHWALKVRGAAAQERVSRQTRNSCPNAAELENT
jgi:hypothetical protein